MQPTSDVSQSVSSAHVLFRFSLRIIMLSVLASFGVQGFAKTLATLLFLAILFCICLATARREAPLGSVLTHWDEAAAYAVIARLATMAA